MIDGKYTIHAKNVEKRTLFTHENAMLFLARDAALIPTLKFYQNECAMLGSGQAHLDSIDKLLGRITEFQAAGHENHSYRIPGLDPLTAEGQEIERDLEEKVAPEEVPRDEIPQQEQSEGTEEEDSGGGTTSEESLVSEGGDSPPTDEKP